LSTAAAAAVAADRQRIAQITNSPEGRTNPIAAIKVALTGASLEDAKIALSIAATQRIHRIDAETRGRRA
jgi:hypothetical protein